MNTTPKLIADYACATGEGPFWHEAEQRLYWCDIPTGKLFRYDPATGEHELYWQSEDDDPIGGFTVQCDGSLALFMGKGAVRVLRDGKTETVIESIEREETSRFNDVIADPKGRVFCGTMSTSEQMGILYRLDTDESIRPVVKNVGTSNGMGFTPDGKGMYHTDSKAKMIYLYDYDEVTGEISNRRDFVSLENEEGTPDGMTVDAEGYVWSARWDGSCLVRYTPEGKEVMRITFPAKKVSSVIFAGPDYTDMYITTAGGHKKDEDGKDAGALFHLNLGIKGVPEFTSAIRTK